jgi:hypothetical protein
VCSGTMPGLADWFEIDHTDKLYSQRDSAMDPTTQGSLRGGFLADCERIHREWDTHARSLDTDSLISLYAQDAILETPLVPAIFEGRSGVLRGHREIRPFFEEGHDADRTSSCGGTEPTIGSPTANGFWYVSIRGKRPTAIKSSSWKSWKSSMV